MTEDKVYVGEQIRKCIKDKMITNGYVISRLVIDGFKMTDSIFSSKIYGKRDKFTDEEVKKIEEYLETSF